MSSYYRKPPAKLDPKYNDPLVTKLINKIMVNGKKATAQQIVYRALEPLAEEKNMAAPELLRAIVEKAAPIIEVKSKRVGGANYQVPVEVRPNRKVILVFRWIINSFRSRSGKPAEELLKEDFAQVLEGTGPVLKNREDLHKMAEANRAFAHFAKF